MSSLKLSAVRKSYGNVEVIKGVDLEIREKEFVVFVGPSGCGKSTLLRMIAGLEHISAGDLEIGGERMNDVDPSKRGIAMVFQSYALYPHMTVRENMGFALRFAGVAKDQIARQVNDAARILALEPLLDRYPKQLSGGQRQRVAIGRAIVRNPQVFLFDEPLSNLDAELRVHMRIEIARLHKELQTTIIYVTHDQVEAMTLADKIVVLRDGIVEQVGTPMELYHKPVNMFVAGFIGSPKMNFIPAVLVPGAEGAMTVGVRPEHLIVGDGPIRGVVRTVENLGSVSYAYAGLDDGTLVTVELSPDHAVQLDQILGLSIVEGRSYRFDAEGRTMA